MYYKPMHKIGVLVQDCSISIANILQILQSCTKPSKSSWLIHCGLRSGNGLFLGDIKLLSDCPIVNFPCPSPGSGFTEEWWRHQMETFFALLALCAGNSPVTGEFPAQRPVTRSLDVFFDLCLNKRLNKQSRVWWFETPSSQLWRHCNGCFGGMQSPERVCITVNESHHGVKDHA